MNARYLPELSAEGMAAQVRSLLACGLTASVEFSLDPDPYDHYWGLWKLPMFGVSDARLVLEEIRACARAHPGAAVQLVGYDPVRQVRAVSLVLGAGA
jgi:ribulose-bisphosphate carboxylase small chain